MQHRETRAANYVLASFSIVSLTLLFLPLSGPVQAVKAGATYLMMPAAYFADKGVERFAAAPGRLKDLITADVENHRLKEEAKRLEWIRHEAETLRAENKRLDAALQLKSPSGRTPVWARVMERDPLRWYRSITVDAGSEQGVTLNSPVLGHAGQLAAIGRVVEVRPKTSVVLLLTDELSSAAAYLMPASTMTATGESPRIIYEGLLQGQGRPHMRMNYLSPEAQIRLGDLVYTSPTSATFPPDVLLGSVSNVFPLDPFLTFQSVSIRPAVEAASLKEVMILKHGAASAARIAETARAAMGAEESPAEEPKEGQAP